MAMKQIRHMAGLGVLLSAAAVATAAWATTFETQGQGSWMSVSGYSNAHYEGYRTTSGSSYALRKLKFYEMTDDPCLIYAYYKTMNTADQAETFNGKGKLHLKDGWSGSMEEVDVGANHFITGIKVCTNDKDSSKAKIKGIKLYGARLNSDGSLTQNSTPATFSRNNCKEWHSKVSCPSGQVVDGIRGYYNDKKYGFSGIAIHCSSIKQR